MMRSMTRAGWTAGLGLVVALAAGCGSAEKGPESTTPTTAEAPAPAPAAGATNVVEMTVDGAGFHPDRIVATAGQPVTLAITRTTDETCGTEIVIASMGVNTKLPLNERVEVTVTPGEKGEIAFACGMDMMKGTIVAE